MVRIQQSTGHLAAGVKLCIDWTWKVVSMLQQIQCFGIVLNIAIQLLDEIT